MKQLIVILLMSTPSYADEFDLDWDAQVEQEYQEQIAEEAETGRKIGVVLDAVKQYQIEQYEWSLRNQIYQPRQIPQGQPMVNQLYQPRGAAYQVPTLRNRDSD